MITFKRFLDEDLLLYLLVGAVKLVDRFEFAAANFSTDVIKGWTK